MNAFQPLRNCHRVLHQSVLELFPRRVFFFRTVGIISDLGRYLQASRPAGRSHHLDLPDGNPMGLKSPLAVGGPEPGSP